MANDLMLRGCGAAGASVVVLAPVADFNADPTTIAAGGTADFVDLSTGGIPTSWLWERSLDSAPGFTTFSTDQHPTAIQFTTTGFYTITLTATNAGGSDDETKAAFIEVTME